MDASLFGIISFDRLYQQFYLLSDAVFTQEKVAKSGDESKEKWDHVTVRPGANMFWWLYYSTNDAAANDDDVPLVIWLQVNGSVLQLAMTYK